MALFVDFGWATAVVSQVFIDNRQEHDGTVVGVSWPLPFGPVIGSTSNEHFPASAATPAVDMMYSSISCTPYGCLLCGLGLATGTSCTHLVRCYPKQYSPTVTQ